MGAVKSCCGGNRSTTYESREPVKPSSQGRRRIPAKPILKPSPVRNLRVDVNADNASATLYWDPPGDGNVCTTSYDVRFKLSDNSDTYNSRNIDSTSIHLTQTCGLKPLMKYDFEVRARSNDEVGEYTLVVAFIGYSIIMV